MRTWRVAGSAHSGQVSGASTTAVGAALIAGPTALAFFAGGYFAIARDWAGLVAAGLATLALGLSGGFAAVLPRTTPVRIALVSLCALAAWTLASIGWAPIAGSAYAAGQIAVLYAVGLIAAAVVLRRSRSLRAALEPTVALGVLIVTGYGLAGRLLPGLITMARSVAAEGRLEQPLTYWNAEGELAAIGLVLCARLAGDHRRPLALRAAAAAAGAPIGLALYLSFSRGALYACVAGLLTLLVAAPTRGQLRGAVTVVGAAILNCAAVASLHGVTGLQGDLSTRETQGLEALIATVVAMLAAGAVMLWLTRASDARELRLPRHAGWWAALLVCAGLALAIAVGAKEQTGVPLSGGAARLTTLQSNRYDYWHVAFEAFEHAPVIGVGAGGWAVWWLQKRPYSDGATDAHSLEVQTLAELGLIGLALLAVFLAAVGFVGRAALRADRAAAAGPLAGCMVWLAHSPLDWDWQMPAVTLVAVLLAGALIGTAEPVEVEKARSPRAAAGLAGVLATLLAAVLCAWFVLGVRQAQSQNAAEAILDQTSHPVTDAQAVHVTALLKEAGTLNPDRQIALDRGLLLLERNQELAGRAVIRKVTAAEPQNLQAWLQLAHAASGDPALGRYAVKRVLKLEPLLPGQG
jgi:hypothetical protein